MAWHGMAWHSMALHGMAWRGVAWHGMAWHSTGLKILDRLLADLLEPRAHPLGAALAAGQCGPALGAGKGRCQSVLERMATTGNQSGMVQTVFWSNCLEYGMAWGQH